MSDLHAWPWRTRYAESALRILFASENAHLPEFVGGIERNTQQMCRMLRSRGVPNAVVAAISEQGWVSAGHRALRKVAPGAAAWPDRFGGVPVFRFWRPSREIGTAIAAFRPSVAIVQHWLPGPLAEAFVQWGIPTIIYLHTIQFDFYDRPLRPHPLLRLFANSDFTAGRARVALGCDAQIVRPIVPPEYYKTETTREMVVFVNPRPEKGDDIAFALAAARPDIPFMFLEAWDKDPARTQAGRERAGRLHNVTWAEPTNDMRSVYARARVALIPSRCEETWGRVATEAQFSGIPVLASDRGGLPESVGPGGLLVSPDAPLAAWSAALGQLWDDADTYAACSAAALRHASRPDIVPERITDDFLRHTRTHLEAVAGHGGGSSHYPPASPRAA